MSALGNVANVGNTLDAPVIIVGDLGRAIGSYREATGLIHDGLNVHEMNLFVATPRSSGTSVSGWANDLERLLDEIPTVAATCIGDNIGSLVVEHFAATRPDRVERLVLLNPLHNLPASARHEFENLALQIRNEGLGIFDHWCAEHHPEHTTPTPGRQLSSEAIAEAWSAVAAAHTSDLSTVRAPSLICYNESSLVHTEAATALGNQLSDSTTLGLSVGSSPALAISNFLSSAPHEVTP